MKAYMRHEMGGTMLLGGGGRTRLQMVGGRAGEAPAHSNQSLVTFKGILADQGRWNEDCRCLGGSAQLQGSED